MTKKCFLGLQPELVHERKSSPGILIRLSLLKVATLNLLCCVASSKLPQLIQDFCQRDGTMWCTFNKIVVVIVEFLCNVAVDFYVIQIFTYFHLAEHLGDCIVFSRLSMSQFEHWCYNIWQEILLHIHLCCSFLVR